MICRNIKYGFVFAAAICVFNLVAISMAAADSTADWHAFREQVWQQLPAELRAIRENMTLDHEVDQQTARNEFEQITQSVTVREHAEIPQNLRAVLSGAAESRMFYGMGPQHETKYRFDEEPRGGPAGEVNLARGSLEFSATDLELPGRNGLGFDFTRFYCSTSEYAGPLGTGWDHNHNDRVMVDTQVLSQAGRLDWYNGEGVITFIHSDGRWEPQAGAFYNVEMDTHQIVIRTRNGQRIVFERASTQTDSGSLWRICERTTLHHDGNTWTNQLVYRYHAGTDMLNTVVDAYGNEIQFDYDNQGYLRVVHFQDHLVFYGYCEQGRLVEVETPNVAISLDEVCTLRHTYDYEGAVQGSISRLTGHTPPGGLLQTIYEYSPQSAEYDSRVIGVEQRNTDNREVLARWSVTYENKPYGKRVRYVPPEPVPAIEIIFESQANTAFPWAALLPTKRIIPAQQAAWTCQYNQQGLMTRLLSPLGRKTAWEYEEDHENSLMRGNMRAVHHLPQMDSGDFPLVEFGEERTYHPSLPLPIQITAYEIKRDGTKNILETRAYTYNNEGDVLSETEGDITTRYVRNTYGLTIAQINGLGVLDIYRYYSDMCAGEPSMNHGGLLAEETSDAAPDLGVQLAAQAGLNLSELPERDVIRPPENRQTQFAYSTLGMLNRETTPNGVVYTVSSKIGHNMAVYDTEADLQLYWYDQCLNRKQYAARTAFPYDEDVYAGETIPGITGRFYSEVYEHDARGLLVSWLQTSEQLGAEEARVSYTYAPDGRMVRRQLAGNAALIREYNVHTGYLNREYLDSGDGELILRDGFTYDAEGFCTGVVDEQRRQLAFEPDPFGRPHSARNAMGTVLRSRLDGADRVVEETVLDKDGRVLNESVREYTLSGLLHVERQRRLAWNDAGEAVIDQWLVGGERQYNEAGQCIAQRSARVDSWTRVEYDGLGRRASLLSAEGDKQVVYYDGDNPAVTVALLRNSHTGDITEQASITFYDERRNPSLVVPCSTQREPLFLRATAFKYDPLGRMVISADFGRSRTLTSYDSLNREKKRVMTAQGGKEKPRVKTFSYDNAGRITRETLLNDAMALMQVGDSETVNAQAVQAPQTRRLEYDLFGRLSREIQPDGLATSRSYGGDSMLARLVRTRDGKSHVLSFKYDPLKRLASIHTQEDAPLQEFAYDPLDRLIAGRDFQSENNPIALMRRFDSLGNMLDETLSVGDKTLPGAMAYDYDIEQGTLKKTVTNLDTISPELWTSTSWATDLDGRVVSVALDDDNEFCRMTYRGTFPLAYRYPSSGFEREVTLSPEGDPIQYQWRQQGRPDGHLFNIRYFYDDYGRVEASDMDLPSKEIQVTHLHEHNQFSELVADGVIRKRFEDRNERMNALHDRGNFNFSTAVERYTYDQAANQTRHYRGDYHPQGEKEANLVLLRLLSPAQPIECLSMPDCEAMTADSQRREAQKLMSNRLGATAFGVDLSGPQTASAAQVDSTYAYDFLGRMTAYTGFLEGTPVRWEIQYDHLDRVVMMIATAVEGKHLLMRLHFASDVLNRRVLKRMVFNKTSQGETGAEFTTYDGNNPLLVVKQYDGSATMDIAGEYLWGPGTNEAIMVVLPEQGMDGPGGDNETTGLRRHYLFQDRTQSVVLAAVRDGDDLTTLDILNYMGFGESAALARVMKVESSARQEHDADVNVCKDGLLDGSAAKWIAGQDRGALILTLEKNVKIANLSFWADQFPGSFDVYVVPDDANEMDLGFISSEMFTDHATRNGWKALSVQNNIYPYGEALRRKNPNSVADPYELPLGGRKGTRIVLTWVTEDEQSFSVREFFVYTAPNPPASLAFAGAWLDQETGLYYHGARYRLPAMGGKFISPDPLGFLAGTNLYAYAHNNPLAFYDPDGEYAHILIGAGVGAVLGGGGYALSTWLSGGEWSWAKFGIYTTAGAASGALAAATFGASIAYTAGASYSAAQSGIIASSLSGLVGGASYGGISSGGVTYVETGDLGQSLKAGLTSAAVQGGLGLVGGASGGAVLSKLGGSFWGALGSGVAGGGVAGGVGGGVSGFRETGTFMGMLQGMAYGSAQGAVLGGVIAGSGWGVGRASGMIRRLPPQPDGLPDMRKEGLLVRTNARRGDYGKVKTEPGMARHHRKPLALGGKDTADNISMVPLDAHRQNHPGTAVVEAPLGTIFY